MAVTEASNRLPGLPETGGLREQSRTLLEAAVECSYDSILITGADLDEPEIVYVNQAFCRMTGYTAEEVLGKTPALLQGERTDRRVTRRLREALEAGRSFEGRTVNYRKGGVPFHIEWRTSPVHDEEGRVTHFVAVQRDVSAEVHQIQRLKRRAEIDGLTRLYVREAGESALGDETERAERRGCPLSVILLDIDHFKRINDEHGHAMGDRVLQRIASLLDARIRGQDLAIRWGGEEFVLVLRDTELAGALLVAESLRAMAEVAPQIDEIEITISAGVAERSAGEAAAALIERADQALYAAKRAGRNRVQAADRGN